MNVVSLVSRSGPCKQVPRSGPILWPLTVIQVRMYCFQYSRQSHATYHGCALPTELRWHIQNIIEQAYLTKEKESYLLLYITVYELP